MRIGFFRKAAAVAAACLLSLLVMGSAAQAKVAVRIDISSQTMFVSVNGWPYASWRVSTARRGYWTPRGSFRPYLLKRMHYSSKYENSPMPHSVFFRGGYAIHGTGYLRSLGRPASHGCIRLAPGNAARLYGLIRQYGKAGTRIVITN
ncbi:L,D-transpeptidase [Taklimakanibacter deserti]|uniref:L,D-transpeptidase n=1 Tax=Taklimakanibacter deserti TaxID=2267839 RepID=UPI000E6566C1